MASFLQRVAQKFGLLPSSSGRPLVYSIPVHTFSPRRGSRSIMRAYRENGWLQMVVDTVADSVAAPCWRVYKATSKTAQRRFSSISKAVVDPRERRQEQQKALSTGDLTEVPEHELTRLLTAPTPLAPGREVLKVLQVHLDLAGEAFMWLRRANGNGPVNGYEPVPPSCVLMTPTSASPHFHLAYNNFTGRVAESDMIWLKRLDPDNPEGRGAGRGLALGDELDTAQAIQVARKVTFERGGLPPAVIGVEGENAEDELEDLEKKYEEKHTGPENVGRLLFVTGKTTLSAVQQDFRALQMDEVEKGLRAYVRMCFNVSPELVGDLSSSNRSTADAAKYILAQHATLPRLEFLRSWWALKLVPQVDRDAILEYDDPRPQEFERVLAAMTASPNPAFYMNELRELAGYKADPKLKGVRFMPLPGAQPVQDDSKEPRNPPPPRGPAAE